VVVCLRVLKERNCPEKKKRKKGIRTPSLPFGDGEEDEAEG